MNYFKRRSITKILKTRTNIFDTKPEVTRTPGRDKEYSNLGPFALSGPPFLHKIFPPIRNFGSRVFYTNAAPKPLVTFLECLNYIADETC